MVVVLKWPLICLLLNRSESIRVLLLMIIVSLQPFHPKPIQQNDRVTDHLDKVESK